MDLRLLRHFVVVAEQLHFRRASQILGTAQPTLSQQIAALEEHVRVRLFDRSQRTVRLTHAGTVFLRDVRKLLADYDAAAERAHRADQGHHNMLTVGAVNGAVFTYLPRVVDVFRTQYPDVSLQISVMHGAELLEGLRRHDIDLGFARYKPTEGLVCEILCQHPLRCVLPANHPAAQGRSVNLASLTKERLVIYPRAVIGDAFDQVLALCRKHRFFPESIKEATGIESLMGLIACGGGIGILPASWEAIRFAAVTAKPIDGAEDQSYESGAFWHEEQNSPLVESFVETARAVCAMLPAADALDDPATVKIPDTVLLRLAAGL